ncbi:MAG: glycosyltransferase family 4 protein [Anaerolineales bacterium]|nr:glycosyltransferase family 4 protein [Anaerolineales bacterium]
MKVAYVVPSLRNPSGWRSHATAFLRGISQFVEPSLYVAKTDQSEAEALFPDFPLFVLPVTQEASLHNVTGIRSLLASQQTIITSRYPSADLVHSLEAYPTGLVGSWLARKLGCPHAMTSHGTYGVIWRRYWLDRRAYRGALARTRLICPVSHSTASMMRKYFHKSLKKCLIRPIMNGNDYYLKFPQQAALERRFPETPTLLTVGDIKHRKGQHISLLAFAKVKQELPQARYILVGNFTHNDYFQDIEENIEELKINDVIFTGVVSDEDLQRYYQEASLFVLTPQELEGDQFEGFGLVYLEAGAYGLPVVGTRTGGVADAVRDGMTGLLAQPEDVEGIAEAILRILKDPSLAHQMGRSNRLWAETLTWDKNAGEHFQAYQEVVKR